VGERLEGKFWNDPGRIRDMLVECFPELRGEILEYEDGLARSADEAGLPAKYAVDVWVWIGDYFVQEVLSKALRGINRSGDQAVRCARFLEQALELEADVVDSAIRSRAVDYLLGYSENWDTFAPFSGPRLSGLVEEMSQYYRSGLDSSPE
jgi:hypothetical protein